MKRAALWNNRVGVSRRAFRARKVFGAFEERAPGYSWYGELETPNIYYALGIYPKQSQTRRSILATSLAVILKRKPCLFVLF